MSMASRILYTATLALGLSALTAAEPLPEWKEPPASYPGKRQWAIRTEKIPVASIAELANFKQELEGINDVLRIKGMLPGATGEGDIQEGDILIKISGKPATELNGFPTAVNVREYDMDFHEELLPVQIWRGNGDKGEILDLNVKYGRYYNTQYTPFKATNAASEFESFIPEWWDEVVKRLKDDNLYDNTLDLLRRLVYMDSYVDPYRLQLFRYLAHNPFKIEAVSESLITRARKANGDQRQLLDFAKYALDFSNVENFDAKQIFAGGDLNAHLDYIENILKQCAEFNQQALAKISKDEMDFVLANRDSILESFTAHHMLSYERDVAKIRSAVKVMETLRKIDFDALYKQAALAMNINSDEFLASLQRAVGANRTKGIVAAKNTPYGKIVIAGDGENRHTEDCAVLIDLGGNDLYLNNQGASVPGKIPTSVFIDLGGNDSYESTDRRSQGSGDCGVGLLIDKSGDDQYIGLKSVQGNAFGGIGMLLDASGNDTYRAMYFAQGAAFFGIAMLIDNNGDDRYEGHQTSQGVGGVYGIGLLSDMNGNDNYYCKGSQQTSYDTRGHFEGWGQGSGIGLRPFASGGIGLLLDWNGHDRMEGGTFTQGGGYYYGLGMLYNGGMGDDLYIGTRYAQGYSAHQAMGIFVEEGGNDTYRTTHCVAQGLSWDETIVLFLDKAGNDDYDGQASFSQCATANNGLCIFRDLSGNDRYVPGNVGESSYNEYHGGTSLSVFIDEGSGEDTYISRKNNTVETGGKHTIFIDK